VRGRVALSRSADQRAICRSSQPTCTVPAPCTPGARHGIGARNAQFTFTTGVSHWKRSRSARSAAGTTCDGSSSKYRLGADTSAMTARRARTLSPLAVRTPPARPPATSMRSTRCPVYSCAPAACARRANAAASSPAPPTGTGKPTSWPSIASSQP
jgi:hypothetical protein